ncbi:MAG TPA: UDP-N-acetylglucosamine 2-epimerase [Gemmatimonadaceae bacterium]|nr:UDP-N-acetylglucosamine 2-epimerase [Gemmatimonadaceae bacterium]
MKRRRKVAVIASSRASYGYKRRIIGLLERSKKSELQLIVTGMHLLKPFGYSVQAIEADGFPIAAKVDMMIGGDTPAAWTKSIGVEIESLSQVFSMLQPDLLVVTGDRGEMFGAAVTGAYMNIPIAHIQAGDVTGHIDGNARHAITKLAHIHLAACEDSADRVRRLGEEPWRVFNVGAPQLDEMLHGPSLSLDTVAPRFGLDPSSPFLLVIQHAVLAEVDDAYAQMNETMLALRALETPCVIVYPNADSGGLAITRAVDEHKDARFIHATSNIERPAFITLLKHASAVVGNSSCGILEAPSFKVPAVNIGTRQRGRMQASNVINTWHDRREIGKAVKTATSDRRFRARLAKCVNPYGDGHSAERIVKILEDVELDRRLLDKRITY